MPDHQNSPRKKCYRSSELLLRNEMDGLRIHFLWEWHLSKSVPPRTLRRSISYLPINAVLTIPSGLSHTRAQITLGRLHVSAARTLFTLPQWCTRLSCNCGGGHEVLIAWAKNLLLMRIVKVRMASNRSTLCIAYTMIARNLSYMLLSLQWSCEMVVVAAWGRCRTRARKCTLDLFSGLSRSWKLPSAQLSFYTLHTTAIPTLIYLICLVLNPASTLAFLFCNLPVAIACQIAEHWPISVTLNHNPNLHAT